MTNKVFQSSPPKPTLVVCAPVWIVPRWLPDRFSDTHLRTLQRRVQQWRGTMAKELVYAAVDKPVPELPAMPELALVGAGPQMLKFQ